MCVTACCVCVVGWCDRVMTVWWCDAAVFLCISVDSFYWYRRYIKYVLYSRYSLLFCIEFLGVVVDLLRVVGELLRTKLVRCDFLIRTQKVVSLTRAS